MRLNITSIENVDGEKLLLMLSIDGKEPFHFVAHPSDPFGLGPLIQDMLSKQEVERREFNRVDIALLQGLLSEP